jgi:hypothetical protein
LLFHGSHAITVGNIFCKKRDVKNLELAALHRPRVKRFDANRWVAVLYLQAKLYLCIHYRVIHKSQWPCPVFRLRPEVFTNDTNDHENNDNAGAPGPGGLRDSTRHMSPNVPVQQSGSAVRATGC